MNSLKTWRGVVRRYCQSRATEPGPSLFLCGSRRKKMIFQECAFFSASTHDGSKAKEERMFPPSTKISDKGGSDRKQTRKESRSKKREVPFDLFVSCLPGLEPFLLSEMESLNMSTKVRKVRGGVEVETDTIETTTAAFHLWLGTATHVLWRCGSPFFARGLAELERKVALHFSQDNNPWTRVVLKSKDNLDIRVTASKSKLFHTGAIAERVASGIGLAESNSNSEKPQQSKKNSTNSKALPLVVRVRRDMVQISIDTSATPLHQRGYRLQTGKAPLREDLSFALLYAAGWNKDTPSNELSSGYGSLYDPFCGSGTVVIEGAAIMSGLPPGRLRPAPLVGSSSRQWKELVEEAIKESKTMMLPILARDRNAGAIKAAKANAERAGVLDRIDFEIGSVGSPLPARAPKMLIATNPPRGGRLSKRKDLFPLYYTLGDRIREGAHGASVMVQDIKLMRKTLFDISVAFTTQHGGKPVSTVLYKKAR